MKKFNIILIAVYLILMVYFAIFNWSIFISMTEVNVGFGSFFFPVIPLISLVSLLFLFLLWFSNRILLSKMDKTVFERDSKLAMLKAEKYDMVEKQLKEHYEILMDLQETMNQLLEKYQESKGGSENNEESV